MNIREIAAAPIDGDLRDLVAANRPTGASQTLLKRFDVCPRSAALYVAYKGGAPSHNLIRGTVFHKFAEEAINMLIASDEQHMPMDVARDLMQQVIAGTDEPLPSAEQDLLRIMAHHFADGFYIHDLEKVLCVETPVEWQVGGWTIRMRVDYAYQTHPQGIAIRDWKTAMALPSEEEFAQSFQTTCYAAGIFFGTVDGERIGDRFAEFDVGEVFPRRVTSEGEMAIRSTVLTRDRLYDFKLTVERMLERLEDGFENGNWPAVPGAHCTECAAPAMCPIASAFREFPADGDQRPQTIERFGSLAEAEDAAMRLQFLSGETARLRKSLKAWVQEHGPVFYGKDRVITIGYQERRSVKDYDELEFAIEGAVQFGHPFKLEDHIRRSNSTPFENRKVKPEDLNVSPHEVLDLEGGLVDG